MLGNRASALTGKLDPSPVQGECRKRSLKSVAAMGDRSPHAVSRSGLDRRVGVRRARHGDRGDGGASQRMAMVRPASSQRRFGIVPAVMPQAEIDTAEAGLLGIASLQAKIMHIVSHLLTILLPSIWMVVERRLMSGHSSLVYTGLISLAIPVRQGGLPSSSMEGHRQS